MRFSVLADFVCGFAVLDEIFFGFAVSSIPQCPPRIFFVRCTGNNFQDVTLFSQVHVGSDIQLKHHEVFACTFASLGKIAPLL